MKEYDDFSVFAGKSKDSLTIYESFIESEKLIRSSFKKCPDIPGLALDLAIESSRPDQAKLFRKRDDANEILTSVWISKVKRIANLYILLNKPPVYTPITQQQLASIAKSSVDVKSIHYVAKTLSDMGIILVCLPSIDGMKLDGAVFLSSSSNPVVALSLRYSRIDYFWFTLMHELSHIYLHYETIQNGIVDNLDEFSDELMEVQANKFAKDILINRSLWRSCKAKYTLNHEDVYEFAASVSVHPAIVAGRIHRELNRYDIFSKIVTSVNVRKELLGYE